MSDLPTAQRADSRCAAGRPNHDRSIQEKNKENPERKVVPDLFRRRGFPTEKTYQDGAGFSLKEGGLLLLSAAKEKKEKKAIRHRGVGAPNKGMSRNRSRDTMGLIGPGKTMLRSGPLQGSGAPTSTREWDLPSHGFSRQLRCPKVSKGRAESPLARPQAQNLFLAEVLTRRLRRGSRACSPMGRSHFSFGGERKVCKRKPAARRLREKGSYCPF